MRRVNGMMLAAGTVLVLGASAFGGTLTIRDRNALADVDPDSTAGMYNWEVDGTDSLFQQWFWVRPDGASFETPLNGLTLTGTALSDTNPFEDPASDTLSMQYQGFGLRVTTTFQLRGSTPGSGTSTIGEQIRITNISTFTQTISFFQYNDFDLRDTAGGDTVQIFSGNTAIQTDGSVDMAEVAATPAPTAYQVGTFPTILNSLQDGAVTTLNNFAGPIGPGDATWAFQWTVTLNPGQELLISKNKFVQVPGPGSLALAGLAGLVGLRRKR